MFLERIELLFHTAKNMGFRYVIFRIWYKVQMNTGLMKLRFPVNTKSENFQFLGQWRSGDTHFFFDEFSLGRVVKSSEPENFDVLVKRVNLLKQNKFTLFSSDVCQINDWHTHPETGFQYDRYLHWSQVSDFSEKAGDIKFVWEKSRFGFLYDLIRFDFHFKESQSEYVLRFIEDWIAENPVNCGPNWVCSQEISLRVLNWTFALRYYKHAPDLTEDRFNLIVNSIYQQVLHVRRNIRFSQIAVRNNHVLTEMLCLYLVGLFYPCFKESATWKNDGKKWFETEIIYQIEEDGSYLQHSMNYHRVVVQLLSWAIRLSELNGERFDPMVYDRAEKSLSFLLACQDHQTGWLPNYGNNDGALFFPLTNCHFRDFRPQLGALGQVLGKQARFIQGSWQEEANWYFGDPAFKKIKLPMTIPDPQFSLFGDSGYGVVHDTDTLSFLRSGTYKHRPFQADNLHLDIWAGGENILRDAGTYKYNTENKWTDYFAGTGSHNTVVIGDLNQMTKGARFIWYHWITSGKISQTISANNFILEGEFEGFLALGKCIVHRRRVSKTPGKMYWEVEDWIKNKPDQLMIHQIWHPGDNFFDQYAISAFDENRCRIGAEFTEGWYSETYGKKKPCSRVVFSVTGNYIKTIINLNT